jgi:hypothetical protein
MKKSPYITLLFLAFLVIGVTGGTWTANQFGYKPGVGARGAAEKNFFDAGLDRIDTRFGKEIWVGDPLYGATLQTALTAIGSNNVILRVPPGTHNIAADLSIPVNVSLKVERGAILSVATGKTLTVSGGLEAALHPIFTCAGTGTVIFGNQVPRVYPQWFGAVGNNIADDSTAINLAAAVARGSMCKRLALPACTGHKVASQLDFQQLHVEGKATITSSYDGHAVLIGNGPRLDIELSVDRSPAIRNAGTSGIWVSQLNYSNLTLASSHSYIGIKFEAGTGGMAYNTITLKNLHYNNIGLMVHVPAGVAGWANENLVIGGSFGGAVSGCLSAITLLGEGTNAIDKWTFLKPSFEISEGTAAAVFTKAQNCHFHDVRYECGTAVPVALFNDRSYGNVISLGSVAHTPYTWNVQTGGSYGTMDNDVRMSGDYSLHRLTDAASFNSAYHDGTYLHVPGFQLIDPPTGVVSRKLNTTNLKLIDGRGGAALVGTGDSYVNVGITVNFYDDMPNNTSYAKKLYIKNRLLDKNQEAAIWIKCFDSAGNVLSGSSPAYVQGNRWAAVSTFYKIYGSNRTQAIIFHKDVAKVLIGVAANGYKLTGLEIYSPYQADGYLDYTGPKELPGVLYAANAPTKWHFQVGDVVRHEAPAVGSPQGWTCIKRTSTTLTADGSGGNLTITVASITGIASGDIIGVKLNTGQYHFTTVNGAPAGNTVTLTAALPGSGVVATSGNAVIANLWAAMPNL